MAHSLWKVSRIAEKQSREGERLRIKQESHHLKHKIKPLKRQVQGVKHLHHQPLKEDVSSCLSSLAGLSWAEGSSIQLPPSLCPAQGHLGVGNQLM